MINPGLYSALCATFGIKNVKPVKQGVRGKFKFGTKQRVIKGKVEDYRTICKIGGKNKSLVGEEFRIPCPFCHDHLPRLYINHLWGTKDIVTGHRYLWLANCYNENCMSVFENRKRLYEMVSDRMVGEQKLNKGFDVEVPDVATWPGDVWSLYDVAKREPSHPAIKFCFARFWDAEVLSKQYGVRVLMSTDYWHNALRDRIVVPVYGADKQLKTWSARRVHEEEGGAKWLHCPYIGTGNAIYGLKVAKTAKVGIIVEGPADVWAWQGAGAGIFGKHLQEIKAKRIAKSFSECTAIGICLDPEQDLGEKINGKEHHIVSARKTLEKYTDLPIVEIWLPLTKDPDKLDHDILQYHLERSADEQEIKLC